MFIQKVRVARYFIDLLSRCSWSTLYGLSDFSAFVLFRVLGYRKSVINRNLKASFPEKTNEEIAEIRRRFYTHFTDLIVETIKCAVLTKEEVRERIFMSEASRDCLRNIHKGAVVLLGHRGNWELVNLFISALDYVEPVVVYKPLANPGFEEWFRQTRTRFGSTMTPMNEVYEELKKERTLPYAVYLVNDQSPNPGKAYWTRFLNQDTGVFRGAEIISRKHNAAVIFCDISRIESKRGCYEVSLELFTEEPRSFPQNAILENQVRRLEENILKQPFNWLWSHRRWKHSRPQKLGREQLSETSG